MDLSLSEDQLTLRAAFAEFFDSEATLERVRAAEPLGFDQDLWAKLAGTGAVAMGLPEDAGGGGASHLDLVLVAEQYGRRIAPVPFVEAAAAAHVLSQAASAGHVLSQAASAGHVLSQAGIAGLMSAVTDGSAVATIALSPARDGRLRLVPAGAVAEIVVALDGDRLIALRREPGPRPHVEPSPNFGSSPLADWPLDDGERIELAAGPAAVALYQDGVSLWQLLMAAALGGLRASALELGVSYVKVRKAFGVIIGSFQAIQHRLADLAVAGDGAQLLMYEAAWARDTGQPGAAALAAMAFLFAADTAFRTTRECLQFHGGYGFTLEYDIQLYFRRAKAWPLALGDPKREYQRLAGLIYPEKGE
jgi:alkylation response protein AidB-like acyl-CoA dehydrogenase